MNTHPPMELTDFKPHLIQALYTWLNENGLTPHVGFLMLPTLGVDFPVEGVVRELAMMVQDPETGESKVQAMSMPTQILNIADRATRNLHFDDRGIHGTARFAGSSRSFFIPFQAIYVIYTREQSENGMPIHAQPFPIGATITARPDAPIAPEDPPEAPKKRDRPPFLKVVK